MNFISKVLVGLGALFVVVVVLFVVQAKSSLEFQQLHSQFVEDYSLSFSNRWDITEVSSLTTEHMLSQVNTPKGVAALNIYRKLGHIKSISELEIKHFGSGEGSSKDGVFQFRGNFDQGVGLVTVSVLEQDGTVRVNGFNVVPMVQGPVTHQLTGNQE
jgi:hypothetical protein